MAQVEMKGEGMRIGVGRKERLTLRPGVSIPAVTTRLDMTKQDMRKGRKTGCPVSVDLGVSSANGLPFSCCLCFARVIDLRHTRM